MAGNASRQNGKLGGRPSGRQNNKTLERETQRKAYEQMVLERLRPIFEHQYSLVKGVAYLYRLEEKANGAKENVLVTDADEIADVLAQMDSWEGQVVNDQYYYVTVRAPENTAIKDMLDRSIGKSAQPISGDPDNRTPIPIMYVPRDDGDTPDSKTQ